MKQHISVDEFYKLSKDQQRRLEVWCFTHRYFTRLAVPGEPARFTDTKTFTNHVLNPIELSIGQMIEFLSDTGNNFWISYDRNPMLWSYTKGKTPHPEDQNTVPEICDTLWKAVKEELEKEAKKD